MAKDENDVVTVEMEMNVPTDTAVLQMCDYLGAESGNQWLNFMDYTYEILGNIVSGRGKPSAELIKESIIGKAGFTSFKEMVETPVQESGLGWNISAWTAWRRAYSVVIKHPYLRDLELTASSINTIYNELKKEGFPENIEAFNEYQVNRASGQKDRQAHSLADAQRSQKRLIIERDELLSAVERLEANVHLLESNSADSNQTIINLTASNAVHEAHAISQSSLIDNLTALNDDLSKIEGELNKEAEDSAKALRRAKRASENVSIHNKLPRWKKLLQVLKNTPLTF
jgi:hypothetical protein